MKRLFLIAGLLLATFPCQSFAGSESHGGHIMACFPEGDKELVHQVIRRNE